MISETLDGNLFISVLNMEYSYRNSEKRFKEIIILVISLSLNMQDIRCLRSNKIRGWEEICIMNHHQKQRWRIKLLNFFVFKDQFYYFHFQILDRFKKIQIRILRSDIKLKERGIGLYWNVLLINRDAKC